jgi:hypothetical protein
MAKVKVKARVRGQKPDRTWAKEGETFEVEEGMISYRWMTRLDGIKSKEEAEAKAKAEAEAEAKAKASTTASTASK